MTMGDKVSVLRGGVLQQSDKPQVLYDEPKNMFVAEFIGSPAINLYEAILADDASTLHLGSQQLVVDDALRAAQPGLAAYKGLKLALGIRPEDLTLAGVGDGGPSLEGKVELVESLGSDTLVHFSLDAPRLHAEGAREAEQDDLSDAGELTRADTSVARLEPRTGIRSGERIHLRVSPERLHFFDIGTGEAL